MASRFAVTFGRKQSAAAVLRRLADCRQGAAHTNVRIFEAGSTPPLRFGTDDRNRFPPSLLTDVPDTARKLARLKADVSRDLEVFAKYPRRLVDLYFEFITARVEDQCAALGHLLHPLGGLFRVEDWAFSALRPLPNAVVFGADDGDAQATVVHHDMAFWTGKAVLVIRLSGSGTPSPVEADACGRLAAMGVRIVTIPAQELGAGIEIFCEPRFPPEFMSFWRGAAYPCSPFRPQGLPQFLSLE